MSATEMGFWDHAEVLRGVLLRIAALVVLTSCLLFAAMPWIFDNLILAPCHSDFILYKLLDRLPMSASEHIGEEPVDVKLINIRLASQFFIHVTSSLWLAVVLTFPACVYLLWGFVSPALHDNEKRGVSKAFFFGSLMFYLGVAIGYFLVFPLTLRFLAGYQLSDMIPNEISLDSYMDNFMTLILVMGIIFELPLVSWLLGKAGILNRRLFKRYRRHAVVAILIAAAVITPTGDPFTLMVVFLPVYILWEFSALTITPRPKTIPSDCD